MARDLAVLSLVLALTVSVSPLAGMRYSEKNPPTLHSGNTGYVEIVENGVGRIYPIGAAGYKVSAGVLPPLTEGDRIVRHSDGALHMGRMSGGKLLLLGLPVSINSAGIEDLIAIPGIGEKTAEAIVRFRERSGNFRTLDDIKDVKGIGAKKLEGIKRYISL